jgi:hypothetical protein
MRFKLHEGLFDVDKNWVEYCSDCTERAVRKSRKGEASCKACGKKYNMTPLGNGKVRLEDKPLKESEDDRDANKVIRIRPDSKMITVDVEDRSDVDSHPIQIGLKGYALSKFGGSLHEENNNKKITEYRQELQQYVKEEAPNSYFFIDETFDDRLVVSIHWGDWKHEHLFLDFLVREFFEKKGLDVKVDVEETETDGSDTYSADHYYSL